MKLEVNFLDFWIIGMTEVKFYSQILTLSLNFGNKAFFWTLHWKKEKERKKKKIIGSFD